MGRSIYHIQPFAAAHIEDAARLLADAYAGEQLGSPHLPAIQRLGNGRGIGVFEDALRATVPAVGVAALHGGKLCGFMVETMRFSWKGQQVAQCDELSHAARTEDHGLLYSLLYQELARRWVEDGRHLHIIGHLAHDAVLKESLYRLGFGALLAEELRDLSPAAGAADVDVLEDPDPALLVDLQREHRGYYRTSPIFLRKDESDDQILSELQEHLASGDKLLACTGEDGFDALFIVGESAADAEGRLLRQTNSAQVKSAYVRPSVRGRGVGTALLQRSIAWARQHGCDRLFVEHETANIPGSAFWAKYFEPYLLISMRYVDNTLPG